VVQVLDVALDLVSLMDEPVVGEELIMRNEKVREKVERYAEDWNVRFWLLSTAWSLVLLSYSKLKRGECPTWREALIRAAEEVMK